MRITGGQFRNLYINPPNAEGLRPLPERERLALFSMLGSVIGIKVVDLFAGSGIVALEFLSRGASEAIAVELNRQLCRFMRDQSAKWAVNLKVVCGDVMRFLERQLDADMVFMGPPNNKGYVAKVLDRLYSLGYRGIIIVQRSHKEPLPTYAKVLRTTGKDESIIDIITLDFGGGEESASGGS